MDYQGGPVWFGGLSKIWRYFIVLLSPLEIVRIFYNINWFKLKNMLITWILLHVFERGPSSSPLISVGLMQIRRFRNVDIKKRNIYKFSGAGFNQFVAGFLQGVS